MATHASRTRAVTAIGMTVAPIVVFGSSAAARADAADGLAVDDQRHAAADERQALVRGFGHRVERAAKVHLALQIPLVGCRRKGDGRADDATVRHGHAREADGPPSSFNPCAREAWFRLRRHPTCRMHVAYACGMTTIQVRNVPDGISRALKAKAALEGRSLSDYLLRELERIATRPSRAELIERIISRGIADLPAAEDVLAEQRPRR